MSPTSAEDAHLPAPARGMLEEVRAGLTAEPRQLPPKFFYDERGSELFEEITRTPEYYPTRAERALLESRVAPWLRSLAPQSLVELGAGSAEKTRVLLDAMTATDRARVYAPLDVSAEFLAATAHRLRASYPALHIEPIVADLSGHFRIPRSLPRPLVVAFLGSTIGNFERQAAVVLLRQACGEMEPDDRLLLGVDLKKDPARITAAYNDSRGVTAQFNLNVLRVLNRELGADFDLAAFEHHAFYDPELGRVEMHLVARRPVTVRIPDMQPVAFRAGETIRTEISRKYDRPQVERTLRDAGLTLEHWFTDDDGDYALAVGRR